MILNNHLEYQLPKLSLSETELVIETKDTFAGSLTIKNIGGGQLHGRILSKSPALTFSPEQWEGNSVAVSYRFSAAAAGLSPGDVFSTEVHVSSSGGEIILPCTAKLTKMAISTTEGYTIANIADFYEYASKHPVQARRIFTDSEFYMLLLATGYEYMEVYENLHKDANRERAMDNFFILSGLKEKTTLTMPPQVFEFTAKPGDNARLSGNFQVIKSDAGYVEAPVTIRNNAPWLVLSASRLISGDFNADGVATVSFTIDPERITPASVCETIELDVDNSSGAVDIVFRRLPPVAAKLGRLSYRFEDSGVIQIRNNSGEDMQIELACGEAFVRFAARKYIVGAYYEIPFEIKLPTLMSAQMLFKKLPYLHAMIEARAIYQGKLVQMRLPLTVGEWK